MHWRGQKEIGHARYTHALLPALEVDVTVSVPSGHVHEVWQRTGPDFSTCAGGLKSTPRLIHLPNVSTVPTTPQMQTDSTWSEENIRALGKSC